MSLQFKLGITKSDIDTKLEELDKKIVVLVNYQTSRNPNNKFDNTYINHSSPWVRKYIYKKRNDLHSFSHPFFSTKTFLLLKTFLLF